MSPLVSIVIPTFNRPHYLKEAVRSALAQTYPRIEVLAGDNGPEDVTRDWERELLEDRRFSYRRNPRNFGMAGNFNALADAAQGEFLVAIGDDDRLLPEFVERLMKEMRPEVNLVFCDHYLINQDGARLEPESRQYSRRYGRDRLHNGILPSAQIAAWQQSIAVSAALMRTSDMRRLRFREDINTPDAEFFIRLAQEGATFAFVPDFLVEYRVHQGTSTSSGLHSEGLVEYLLPLAVSTEVETYKRDLLGPLMMNAVSRCLRLGDRERARRLLQSPYYPRRLPQSLTAGADLGNNFAALAEHRVKSVMQRLCARLPARIGCPTYRAVRAAKDWIRS